MAVLSRVSGAFALYACLGYVNADSSGSSEGGSSLRPQFTDDEGFLEDPDEFETTMDLDYEGDATHLMAPMKDGKNGKHIMGEQEVGKYEKHRRVGKDGNHRRGSRR